MAAAATVWEVEKASPEPGPSIPSAPSVPEASALLDLIEIAKADAGAKTAAARAAAAAAAALRARAEQARASARGLLQASSSEVLASRADEDVVTLSDGSLAGMAAGGEAHVQLADTALGRVMFPDMFPDEALSLDEASHRAAWVPSSSSGANLGGSERVVWTGPRDERGPAQIQIQVNEGTLVVMADGDAGSSEAVTVQLTRAVESREGVEGREDGEEQPQAQPTIVQLGTGMVMLMPGDGPAAGDQVRIDDELPPSARRGEHHREGDSSCHWLFLDGSQLSLLSPADASRTASLVARTAAGDEWIFKDGQITIMTMPSARKSAQVANGVAGGAIEASSSSPRAQLQAAKMRDRALNDGAAMDDEGSPDEQQADAASEPSLQLFPWPTTGVSEVSRVFSHLGGILPTDFGVSLFVPQGATSKAAAPVTMRRVSREAFLGTYYVCSTRNA